MADGGHFNKKVSGVGLETFGNLRYQFVHGPALWAGQTESLLTAPRQTLSCNGLMNTSLIFDFENGVTLHLV